MSERLGAVPGGAPPGHPQPRDEPRPAPAAYAHRLMVIGLAFLATAVATLFAQATLVRYTKDHRPQDKAWTISLALFALASAALATGVSTGWDNGTFRVFFLLGAV